MVYIMWIQCNMVLLYNINALGMLYCVANTQIYFHFKQFSIHSRTSVVDTVFIVDSPGPMMVYALTLNVIIVLGGRYLSVCCVADVLV